MSDATKSVGEETTAETDEVEKEETKVGGLTPEMAGVVAYLLSPLTGILVFVMEDENEFVRFHGMQSIIFGVAWFAVFVVISVLAAITFGLAGLLYFPALFVAALMWAFLMYKAYQGEMYKLPMIGNFAEQQI